MKFNIKHLDLPRVVQSLYRHSLPAGIGILEYLKNKQDELSREQAEVLLMDGAKTVGGNLKLITIDYVHGKPLKFEYVVDTGITYATEYDVRNGKYRFFEALKNEFGEKSIFITRKSYEPGHEFVKIDDRKKEIEDIKRLIKENTWNSVLPKN